MSTPSDDYVDTVYVMVLWLPLLLVMVASALHALWNVLVKRAGTSDVLFVWAYSALAAPVWVGLVIWWIASGRPWGGAWWAAIVSMALHTVYAVVLQRAYAGADLSVVYPVSRGLVPVFVAVAATPWAGAPTPALRAALPLVVAGVVLASGAPVRELARSAALRSGVLVATCTSAYTLWDAFAMTQLHVAIGPYLAISSLSQLGVLTLALGGRVRELPSTLTGTWRLAASIAVLVPCSYGLILVAMNLAPAGVIAASRSMTVVFGAVFGVWLLREHVSRRAAFGVALITLGSALSAM